MPASGDGAVVQRVLDELEAGQANGCKAQVIRAAGIANGDRGHAHVAERSEPRLEDRPHGFMALQVHTADFAASVVQVEVAGEFGEFGNELNRSAVMVDAASPQLQRAPWNAARARARLSRAVWLDGSALSAFSNAAIASVRLPVFASAAPRLISWPASSGCKATALRKWGSDSSNLPSVASVWPARSCARASSGMASR